MPRHEPRRHWYETASGIAKVVFPRSQSERSLLMLKLYLDDGGDEDADEVFAVGGYVGSEDQWNVFEPLWTGAMTGPPYNLRDPFHMTDCLARSKKTQFKGWSVLKRDLFLRQLLPITPGCRLVGVGYAISTADFRRIIGSTDLHTGTPLDKFGGLAFAMYACLLDLSRTFLRGAGKQEVAVVFERGTKRLDGVRSFCNWLINFTQWGSIYSGVTDGPKELPGLQAADAIANQTFTCGKSFGALTPAQRRRHDPMALPTPWLELLSRYKASLNIQYFDEQHFTEVVKDWNAYRTWSG